MVSRLLNKCASLRSVVAVQGSSHASYRHITTLAIETSCDDTSVAILEKLDRNSEDYDGSKPLARLHFHDKVTSDNVKYKGVHPIVSLESHQENLSSLVRTALSSLPADHGPRPGVPVDFVAVTRGPGMRSNLSAGLDTAKGLSVAWNVPLVAVNHMQAHALTPRLVNTLSRPASRLLRPEFPFLTLLVSGGHSMLICSASLCNHPTIAETADTAIGESIDKIARQILPSEVIGQAKTTMYGPLLEKYAFPEGASDYDYTPPSTRTVEIERKITKWGWGLLPPLHGTRSMQYSFTGMVTAVTRLVEKRIQDQGMEDAERRMLAREVMRVLFEHLGSRVLLALDGMTPKARDNIKTLVVSGGVAANEFLRHVLQEFLTARGYDHIDLVFPPLSLCTDNAAMIAWTGMEMFEAGYHSDLSCRALRKWSLDAQAEDGGILGVSGWQRHTLAKP